VNAVTAGLLVIFILNNNLTLLGILMHTVAVLCIVPASRAAYPKDSSEENSPEPTLYILEGQSDGDIATGRHRTDGKYK
jgi:hypothetical protein